MKKLLPALAVNELDKRLRGEFSLSSEMLIDNASRLMYDAVKGRLVGHRILVVAGKGNNGSDAISLAILAWQDSLDVSLMYVSQEGNEHNMNRRRCALELGIPVVDDVQGFDVVVDGILGAAFRPPVQENVKNLVGKLNAMDAFRIAVDVPSAYLFRADLTVTFTMLKREEYLPSFRKFTGDVVLINPGFPESALDLVGTDSFLLEDGDYHVPPFCPGDYKNRRGHVGIVGGSGEYTGAPVLSAKAAFHAGAGLVTIHTGQSSYLSVSCYRPAIVRHMPVDEKGLDSLVIGPGWGNDGDVGIFSSGLPKVIDADALKLIGKGCDFAHSAVLTPHIGEMERLCGSLSLPADAKTLAGYLSAVVVLKGASVVISDGNVEYICDGMNPSLGVAGSGDVLSGIIGAFLAVGMDLLDAAVNAVILHQKAGRICHERLGFYDADDLIEEIGRNR